MYNVIFYKKKYRHVVFADTSDEVKPNKAKRFQNHFETDAIFYTTILK